MVSILLGVWNGGGVCCCCPARCSGVACALLIPLQCLRVLLSCHALSLASVWCVGGGCVSVVFVWWGILCPLTPSSWWRVGASWMVGGMVSEGRQCYRLPVECWRLPSVCAVVPLKGGSGGLCVVPLSRVVPALFTVFPVFGLDPALCIVLLPLVLFSPLSLFVSSVTALLVWVCVFVTGLCHCGMAALIGRGLE